MTGISQSLLLQALGWATLNSLWQAGLLWCGFVVLRRFAFMSASRQYGVSVAALGVSLISFVGSIGFYLSGGISAEMVARHSLLAGQNWFQVILTAASLTYLLLLLIPAGRLIQNWRFLRRLRRSQLAKAPVAYRLYVQKVGAHLGIRKPVRVYLSALVSSPVTIGFFKPLILLPVASFNQLSLQQAEAILLHELSHIRRYDYLINIGISIVNTLLYFNPFVRLFVKTAEHGREECCDGMVLQFGYDRLAYAGALLQLEQWSSALPQFALGATGKNQLLARIEAIVGLPRQKPLLRLRHFTGLVASGLTMLALHSLFVVAQKEGASEPLQALSRLGSSLSLVLHDLPAATSDKTANLSKVQIPAQKQEPTQIEQDPPSPQPEWIPAPPPVEPDHLIQVAHTESAMNALAQAEQAKVASVVAATQKVLTQLKWKEVECKMADALTEAEKQEVHQAYMAQVNQINWQQVEEHLASRYQETNWEAVNQYLGAATQRLQLDSLETVYNQAISELQKAKHTPGIIALPDQSLHEIRSLERQLRNVRDSLHHIRIRPVVRF